MTLDRNRDVGTTDAEIADGDLTVERDTFAYETTDSSFEPDVDGGGDTLDSEELEVAEIRADIEEAREEMGGTLRELGDRLEPSHLMNQAKENVREATIGRVEETAKGMSDMVMETIRRNPIPAAMAGAGLALLWMNRSNGSSAGSRDYRAGSYGSTGYRYGETGYGTWDTSASRDEGIGSKVGAAAGTVGDTVGSAASTVGETVGQVGQNVGQTVGQTVQGAGSQLDRVLQSSPLALAAVAAGTGAVVGALIPETQGERQMLGSAGQQIGSAVRDTVSQAADKAEEKLDRAAASSGTS